MEYTIHRVSLDIHSVKSQATLRVKQSDTSRKLHITLCEGGLPYQIAKDCYATFSALKADGNYIHNTCQIDGNTIEYVFTEQTTAAVGNTDCEITLYDNKGQRITSPHFTIIVEERVYNGEEILSSPEANVLDELIDRAEVAVDNAEKVVDSIYHYVENNFANAFKGSMSGAIVQADDVSPVEHIVGCKVRSKNLWKTYNVSDTVSFSNGFVHTYNNGTFTFSGKTTNSEGGGRADLRNSNWAMTTLPPGTYTYSINVLSGSMQGLTTFMQTFDGTAITILPNYTFTLTEEKNVLFGINRPTAIGIEYNVTYNIQIEEGTEATDYAPYVDVSGVKLTQCGKNLASPNLHTAKMGGYTYFPNEDGSVTISGAATTTSQHVIALALKKENGENESVRLVPNQSYTLTIYKDGVKTTGVGTKVEFDDGTVKWGFDKVSPKPRRLTLVYVQFTPAVGDTEFCGTYHVQLELGDKATEYEKYIGDEFAIASDGTINGMTSLCPSMSIFADTADTVIECEYNRDSNKVVKGLYDFIVQETFVNTRISSVSLRADAWEGEASPYSQVVSLTGITENSMVDLTPSVEQLTVFHNKDLAFVTENVGGVVTVYAIGQKPANNYTIPVAITEVKA